jgi:tetratricopeptide (TPR) repeat protein
VNSYLKAIPTAICFFFLFSCGDGEKKEKDTTPTDLKQLNAEIARDTMKSEPYYNRGMYHFKNGNAGEAVKDINKAIKLNSGEVKYHLALGDIHFAMNQTGVTIESLRKAHRLEPKNAEVLGKLGELFYIVRKYDSAIFYLNRSLEFESMNPKIHFQKGMVFKELGDTANAIQSFQTATEQNPEYYEPQVQLGWIHSKKGNGICLNYFDNAIRLKPKSIEARYLKGMFFQNKNDFSNAASTILDILNFFRERTLTKQWHISTVHLMQILNMPMLFICGAFAGKRRVINPELPKISMRPSLLCPGMKKPWRP